MPSCGTIPVSNGTIGRIQRPNPDGAIFGSRCIGIMSGRESQSVDGAMVTFVNFELLLGPKGRGGQHGREANDIPLLNQIEQTILLKLLI